MGRTSGVDARPMTSEDVDAAIVVAGVALSDGPEERERAMNQPPEELAKRRSRYLHVLGTDGPGAWVAEDDGRIVGVSLALRREGLWILSLIAVDEEYQGRRVGRELFDRAVEYGIGCSGWITVSSTHPAAIRSYAMAGMQLRPTLWARGVPADGITADPSVREGTQSDLALADEVDRAVRGVPHGSDLAVMLRNETKFLVSDTGEGRGYALERDGNPWLLAATDEATAAGLLRSCLARASGRKVDVAWISADQNWAVPVVLEAGLALEPAGCVCVGGDVGPLTPYLPSGPFL